LAHNPTIAARVNPETYKALQKRASDQGVYPSTLIAAYVEAGLDMPPPPEPPDGAIVAAVVELFTEINAEGPEFALKRELAVLLARAAEQERGPTQVGAIKELLPLAKNVVGDADEKWEEFRARIATPLPYNPSEEENP
jgi:hypothetical protein